MKYLAALFIGIGLLAHNPASAEELKFGPKKHIGMEVCLVAKAEGVLLPVEADKTRRQFLIKDVRMGASWQVYEISSEVWSRGFYVSCTVRDLISRTT